MPRLIFVNEETGEYTELKKKKLPPNWLDSDDEDNNSEVSENPSYRKPKTFKKPSCIKTYILHVPYCNKDYYRHEYRGMIRWNPNIRKWTYQGTKTDMPSGLKSICDFEVLDEE
jgi:hypothetical protein